MPDPSRDLLPVVLKRAGEDLQPLVDRVKQGTMYTQVRCRSTVSTVCLWYTLRATPSFRVMQVVAPLSSSVEAAASSGVEGIGHLYSHYSPRVSGVNRRKSSPQPVSRWRRWPARPGRPWAAWRSPRDRGALGLWWCSLVVEDWGIYD